MKETRWRPAVVEFMAWALLIGLQATQAGTSNTNPPSAQSTIPYVPTRHDTVRDLLWMADVGTNDVVYDLGSGDGRVVIAAVRDFHARKAVGIEIKPDLVRESRQNAEKVGAAERVQFSEGDLFTADFSEASVVVLYLGHRANLDLRARLVRSLKPGARVVSHQFGMGEWTPDKTFDVRTVTLGMQSEWFNPFSNNPDVPDFGSMGRIFGHDYLSVWVVPAPVAGVWRGKVGLDSGEAELQITLHQRLSGITGSFQFKGQTNMEGVVNADLWGDHLRCWCISTNQDFYFAQMWFDGRATSDTLNGSLWLSPSKETRQIQWTGRRDRAEFAGVWEWTGAMDSPVQIRIERRADHWAVTYSDPNRKAPVWAGGNRPIPVSDFYDFGGGFYFTLLLGLEGNRLSGGTRVGGPEMGWLIGEAIVRENALVGTVAFYPYPDSGFGSMSAPAGLNAATRTNTAVLPPETRPVVYPGRRDWQPKRVTP